MNGGSTRPHKRRPRAAVRLIERFLLGLGIAGGFAIVAGGGTYAAWLGLDAGADGLASKNVSGAMEPTLLRGDYFTARRLPAGRAALRGEVVVHEYPPDPSKRFVKRVVGLPGDTLAMRRGTLVVNGRPVAEAYAWHADAAERARPTLAVATDDFLWQRDYLVVPRRTSGPAAAAYQPSRDDWGPLVVPPDSYFVLGDNRDQSLDSRYWGFVARARVVAEVRRVYFSRDPSSGRIRWSRFGRRLR